MKEKCGLLNPNLKLVGVLLTLTMSVVFRGN